MSVPASGIIKFVGNLHAVFGDGATAGSRSLRTLGVAAGLPAGGVMRYSDFRGKSKRLPLTERPSDDMVMTVSRQSAAFVRTTDSTAHAWGNNNLGYTPYNYKSSSIKTNGVPARADLGEFASASVVSVCSGGWMEFGIDSAGRLINISYSYALDGQSMMTGSLANGVVVKEAVGGIQESASGYWVLVRDSNGRLHFGVLSTFFNFLQLNTGSMLNKTCVRLAATEKFGLMLDSTGKVHATGYNGSTVYHVYDGSLSGKSCIDVACTRGFCAALDESGTIHVFNLNVSTTAEVINTGTLSGRTVKKIAGTEGVLCALDTDGNVHGFGLWTYYSEPQLLANVTGIQNIYAYWTSGILYFKMPTGKIYSHAFYAGVPNYSISETIRLKSPAEYLGTYARVGDHGSLS